MYTNRFARLALPPVDRRLPFWGQRLSSLPPHAGLLQQASSLASSPRLRATSCQVDLSRCFGPSFGCLRLWAGFAPPLPWGEQQTSIRPAHTRLLAFRPSSLRPVSLPCLSLRWCTPPRFLSMLPSVVASPTPLGTLLDGAPWVSTGLGSLSPMRFPLKAGMYYIQ